MSPLDHEPVPVVGTRLLAPGFPLAPLLFLGLDGVLHPNGAKAAQLFMHADALMHLLEAHPELDVVISSRWRLERPWPDLIAQLPFGLAQRVAGCTGGPQNAPFPRHREITEFRLLHGHARPWQALDATSREFPLSCKELIACDGSNGLQEPQLEALGHWLGIQESHRIALAVQDIEPNAELRGLAFHILRRCNEPSVTVLQRALKVGYREALAMLGAYLRA